jgi:hypothetical protein
MKIRADSEIAWILQMKIRDDNEVA